MGCEKIKTTQSSFTLVSPPPAGPRGSGNSHLVRPQLSQGPWDGSSQGPFRGVYAPSLASFPSPCPGQREVGGGGSGRRKWEEGEGRSPAISPPADPNSHIFRPVLTCRKKEGENLPLEDHPGMTPSLGNT